MSDRTQKNFILLISALGAAITVITVNMKIGALVEKFDGYGATLARHTVQIDRHDDTIVSLQSRTSAIEGSLRGISKRP